MSSFNIRIVESIFTYIKTEKEKKIDIVCPEYNHISTSKCFGKHAPFIHKQCFECPHLDLFKWIYIIIDNDMTIEEIEKLKELKLYIHNNLIDIETGILPCDIHSRIEEICDKYKICRGMIFATRNAEALEALTFYSLVHNYIPIYVYKGEIIKSYDTLEKLFNSGYRKLLKDIKTHKKKIGLK